MSHVAHLLDLVEQLASDAGYATARIVLDPREVPPSHPKRLDAALVSALRLPDGEVGINALARRLVDSDDHRLPRGAAFSPFLSPHLFALGSDDAWLADLLKQHHGARSVAGGSAFTLDLRVELQRDALAALAAELARERQPHLDAFVAAHAQGLSRVCAMGPYHKALPKALQLRSLVAASGLRAVVDWVASAVLEIDAGRLGAADDPLGWL